jgi:hypothetical protein
VLGVGAFGVGVVGDGWLDWPGSDPDVPPDPPESLLPSLGQGLPLWPLPSARDVSVDPPGDGSLIAPGVALVEGSGLAAATIATPPVTSNAAAMPAVRTARRIPFGCVAAAGVLVASDAGGAVAAPACWSSQVMKYSFACLMVIADLGSGHRFLVSGL